MGEVFLADQLGPLGPVRPVALKRMLPSLTENAQVVRLFLEEMATAAQLSHPNIAITYDFGEVDGVYFMAMEYVDGLPLDQLIKAFGPLPVDAAVHLALCVTRALVHAHQRQSGGRPAPVVHQDVTPHNVIVARDGEAKLLDFGIARAEAAARQGRLRAKVRYAAPEQLRGAPPDRRFDVWGLGVTLYQALSGELPFPDKELAARLAASEAGRFAPLAEVAPAAAHLDGVIAAALRPDPGDRLANMTAMRDALVAAHPVTSERGRAALRAIVAEVAAAPPHLDGGELTSTGIAVEGSVTPPSAGLSTPAQGAFSDDGPTRITRQRVARAPSPSPDPKDTRTSPTPPPEAPRRGPAWTVALAGLALGAALVIGLRALLDPAPEVGSLTAPQLVLPAPPPADAPSKPTPTAGAPKAAPEPSTTAAPAVEAPEVAKREALAQAPRRESAGRRPARRPRRAVSEAPKTAAADPRPAAPAPRPSEPAKPAAPQSALGLLSVRTVPWARVLVDGRPLGEGVIARRPLDSGPHTLRLIAGAGDFPAREVKIRITGGQTTRVFYDFAEQTLRVTPPE